MCVLAFAGEVCQQGLFSPATASVREGELEKMDPAPRRISGALLEKQQSFSVFISAAV
jgi:hypothetical protein